MQRLIHSPAATRHLATPAGLWVTGKQTVENLIGGENYLVSWRTLLQCGAELWNLYGPTEDNHLVNP